ncbi:nitrogen fixation protein NifZ [Paraburkholderia caribensis]|uniref:Nitrogen fixation protein NifZ n=1 Tax=Paraburkholderia caribensis TaxID=75105 RepID=A0ABV0ECG1_9BURK|nr:nitrogen fixation protein NifZ [Paraburkholderia caribensis]MCO4883361.1 nitrogen fixation protein NifZ [Paraburkholderia caribensis]
MVVLHDSYNDGGYRDRGEGKCLLRAGSLGEIVDVGQVVENGEPLRLSLTAFGRLPGGTKLFLHRCDHRARRRAGRVTDYVLAAAAFLTCCQRRHFARAVFKTMYVRTAQIS